MVNLPSSPEELSRPTPRRADPDAHGQAALFLIESVMHVMIEEGRLTLGAAVKAVQTASDVKVEVAEETGESNAAMQASLALLHRIEQSLETDHDVGSEPNLSVVTGAT